MTPESPIESERIVLAPLEASHLPQLQCWNDDPEVTRFTGKKFDPGADPAVWLAQLLTSPHRVGFAIHLRGRGLIGDLQLEDIDPATGTAELRICIGEKSLWGQGLGTEAVRAACRFAHERLGLRSLYLRVPLGHWRAIRCYLKCGFRAEGVLRAGRRRRRGWADQLLMVWKAVPPAGVPTG